MKRILPKWLVVINIVLYSTIVLYTAWNFLEAQIRTYFDLWFSLGGLVALAIILIPLYTMIYYVAEKNKKKK